MKYIVLKPFVYKSKIYNEKSVIDSDCILQSYLTNLVNFGYLKLFIKPIIEETYIIKEEEIPVIKKQSKKKKGNK